VGILVALFIVVPIVELYVIIKVGSLIGVWPTLALLLADAVLGSLLLPNVASPARRSPTASWSRSAAPCC
jgi:UPF0716 protein FxsA